MSRKAKIDKVLSCIGEDAGEEVKGDGVCSRKIVIAYHRSGSTAGTNGKTLPFGLYLCASTAFIGSDERWVNEWISTPRGV